MISVKVDNQDFITDIGELKTMGDLIELIKATIDPDCIITSLTLAGEPLKDSDWRVPLSVHGEGVLEVTTGDKNEYLSDRLATAENYLSQIIDEFARASELYRSGSVDEANTTLATAVDDLLAFVNWYLALLSVKPEQVASQIQEFDSQIREIKDVCEQLLQQQMFQSWVILGETLQSRLEPQLMKLKSFCERNRTIPGLV